MSLPGKWSVSRTRPLDMVWRIQDFAAGVKGLRELLTRLGFSIPATSSLARAEADIAEMIACFEGRQIRDPATDHRPAWRRAISLADVAKKILAVADHKDFAQLKPHFSLLLGDNEISLFTKTARENAENNKLFELHIGASLMRFMTDCELEDPDSGKASKNPDFIGRWRGKRWGFACKALHSDNPKAAIDRIQEGVAQIKKSGVDAGLVLLNAKNLIPHDLVWRADFLDDCWNYHAHVSIDDVNRAFIEEFRSYSAAILVKASGDDPEDTPEAQLASAKNGRAEMLRLFAGTNALPWMPVVWLTVMAKQTPTPGILAPVIFRFLTAFRIPQEAADAETNDLCLLLSLAIQNLSTTDENLELARKSMQVD